MKLFQRVIKTPLLAQNKGILGFGELIAGHGRRTLATLKKKKWL
jgi:hypothetical protein